MTPMSVEQVMASTMEPVEKDMGKSWMKLLNSAPMPTETSTPADRKSVTYLGSDTRAADYSLTNLQAVRCDDVALLTVGISAAVRSAPTTSPRTA